jgi:hypothetical protein
MRYVKMILIGLLLIVLVYLAEFLVTLPFPMSPDAANAERAGWLIAEYALTALPAMLLTFFAAWFLKLHAIKDAVFHSIVWTLMYAGVIFLLSTLDVPDLSTTKMLFTTPTIYLLFALYFLGPVLYALILGRRHAVNLSSKND